MPRKAATTASSSAIEMEMPANQLPFYYDEAAPRIFTDGIRLVGTPFGVVLVLSQVELGPDAAPRARHVGTVYMSGSHADALLNSLVARREQEQRQAGVR